MQIFISVVAFLMMWMNDLNPGLISGGLVRKLHGSVMGFSENYLSLMSSEGC